MPARLRRVIWSAVIVVVLGAPVIVALAGRVPNTVETNVAPRLLGWPADSVVLGSKALPDGSRLAGARLDLARPEPLAAHDELRLAMELYGATPELISGDIQIGGTDCVYRTAVGDTFTSHRYLEFHRGRECGHFIHGRPTGELALRLVIRGGERIGVMTSVVPVGSLDPSWITLPAGDRGPGGPISVAWARYADTYVGGERRRVDLLGYVWQVSGSSVWLWAAVALALICVCAGGLLLSPGGAGSLPPRPGRILALSGSVAGVGLGIALLYAVLVPPLQAPDEPDHLLSFAQLANRPELADQTATLAKIGHLDRFMFHDDERFRPFNMERPFARPWPPVVFAQPVADRSVTSFLWWTGLAHLLAPFDAPGALLAVRLANAALFALLLGVATAMLLVVSGGEAASPHAVCLALLLVPTLPFFATAMSEFSLLTSFYVLVAAVAVGLFLDTRRGYLLGFPLGIGCSLALASGRNALPYMAVVGALCVGRAILGSAGDQSTGDDRRRSMWFWAGLAAGLVVYPLMATPGFRAGLWPPDAGQMSERFRDAAELLRRHPWMLVVVAPIGFAVERAMAVLRRRLGPPGGVVLGLVRVLGYGVAATVIASLIASAFTRFPQMWNAEMVRPESARVYASQVLQVAVSGFRLTNQDLWLSLWFWGGFGWVDTMPGDGFVTLLVVVAAAGVVSTMACIAHARHVRRAIWLSLLALGWGVALVGYAVSTYYLHRNLHGRYLVGLYLSTLGVCWSVVAWLPRTELPGRFRTVGIAREWLLLVLVAGIHAYALRFILMRYY
ncbi:MAG: hypothetical protein NT151_07620 [Acidobacteria bacterium]|nr:hypothetical protein [Acidobacteriota bacterium]